MPLRSLQALCLVNFFMADVRDGLGPFLGIFLTEHQWKADNIGWMMTAGGLAGLVATMPSRLVADATRHKRGLLVVCCLLITTATLLLWAYPTLFVVGFSQLVTGISAAFIAPLLMGNCGEILLQRGICRTWRNSSAYPSHLVATPSFLWRSGGAAV